MLKISLILVLFLISTAGVASKLCVETLKKSGDYSRITGRHKRVFEPGRWEKVPREKRPDSAYEVLEKRLDPNVLKWVEGRNAESQKALESDSRFLEIKKLVEGEVFNTDKIPEYVEDEGYMYNLWSDGKNPKGIWRRQTVAEFEARSKAWEILLDVDQLSKQEGKKWVFKGNYQLSQTRQIVLLADGGSDAVQLREFDVQKKRFLSDGFFVAESKLYVDVLDENTLIIGLDLGEDTVTESHYPMEVRVWKRGQKVEDAEVVYRGKKSDTSVRGYITKTDGVFFIKRAVDFFNTETWYLNGSKLIRVDIPSSAIITGYFKGNLILHLQGDWSVDGQDYKTGDLISLGYKAGAPRTPSLLFRAEKSQAVQSAHITANGVVVSYLENVEGHLAVMSPKGESWTRSEVQLPKFGTITVQSTDAKSTKILVEYNSFLTPPTLYELSDTDVSLKIVQSKQEVFDKNNYIETQFWATSKDGTQVPYFVVHKKGLKYDGENPTVIYGYGGFNVSELPFYMGDSAWHSTWFDKGGVFVLANIRGGGEFGPDWHNAALKENRQKAYDDFIAVIEDAQTKKITSPRRTGIMGGSNGGLLVGVAMTQKPYLMRAVVSQVPLLDMLRYTELPPGASWIGEYGDPRVDVNMRSAISRYSPFQNVFEAVKYPDVLLLTSTKDDRVHPGHARKFYAKLADIGATPLLYENPSGGHAGASDLVERIYRKALELTFLHQRLTGP